MIRDREVAKFVNYPLSFWLTLTWFTLTYFGLALGRLPWLRIDRTGIAVVGAALMLATGVLSVDEAKKAIDFATIVLLFGMMIVVASLRRAGFFDRLAALALSHVRSSRGLLAATMGLSGFLSAILVNDVVCLALTPLVLHLARRLRIDPKPHLIGLALAANIGSTATLTGNPQNMIIGGLSNISYLRFATKLAPVALISLVAGFLLTAWCYRTTLHAAKWSKAGDDAIEEPKAAERLLGKPHTKLLVKSLVVTLGAVTLFFAGAPMAIVALGAAAVLLLDRVNPARIYQQIDWGLLTMFAGLFVVVHAFEIHVVKWWGVEQWTVLQRNPVVLLSGLSAVLSNLVSNVPAVLLFQSVIAAMPEGVRETAWLALAMSSTLAGNLTILGSVANLIVVEIARREGVVISFWEYVKVGVPVTLVTLALGIGWLQFVRY
jgi:Na+/H+ antiporter NhaD/arsenite permease-like protein